MEEVSFKIFERIKSYSCIYLDAQKVEKLKGLCLQYATSIQLLMPSIDVTNSENTSKSVKSRSRINKSQDRDQQLKLASENVVMSESILYVSSISIYPWSDEIKIPAQYHITSSHWSLLQEIWSSVQFRAPESCSYIEQQFTCGAVSDSSRTVHSWCANRPMNYLMGNTCVHLDLIQCHTLHVRLQRCIAHPNQGWCMFVSCEW